MTKDCCSNSSAVKLNFNLEGSICYCFKKTKQELYDAVKSNSEEEFTNDIKAKMKNPGCFCETANPSGKCCLADINAFIELAKKEEINS